MIISDFTKPQLDYLRANCNFVGDEISIFELRSQGKSLDEITDILDHKTIDGIKYTSRKVNNKINSVLVTL